MASLWPRRPRTAHTRPSNPSSGSLIRNHLVSCDSPCSVVTNFRFPVELNGHLLTALFDTGANQEAVSLASAVKAGVSDAALDQDRHVTVKGAGALEITARQHRFETLRIGSESFHNVSLGVVDFHPQGFDILVGLSYMQTRRIYLSYSTGQLFVQNAQNPGQTSAKPDPCQPTKDMLPLLIAARPDVISHPQSAVPESARADHVAGCAAAVFRLAADGTPRDIELAAGNPQGYGFAKILMQEIAASRFQPPPPEQIDYYYEVRRYHP